MPIHDWTRVAAGIFHDFHHEWISTIKRALNEKLSGTDYYALAEQVAGGLVPDVLTLQRPDGLGATRVSERDLKSAPGSSAGTLMLADNPPQARFRITDEPKWYAAKKMSVVIRHVSEDRVVAVVEIVSPGNKDSQVGLVMLARKAQDLIAAGVNLSLVDLFPPGPRDPHGIHPVVWGERERDPFQFDPKRPLTCASYVAEPVPQAFVNPAAVGERLLNLSVFLTPDEYVDVPLESTYQAAFEAVPQVWRDVLQ